MRKIIVGSRRSKLAMTQTNWVIDQLKKIGAPFTFDLKEIVTKGDEILNVTLSKVGGKGLFVKEIEQAMLNKEIDIAVHSMKDMPAVLPDGLVIGTIPEREDPRDVLISKENRSLRDLPAGAIVGTSSLRRKAQILNIRPDLEIKWIRGNIDTRLKKLETEEYDAIILAAAGLSRMGWQAEVVSEYLEPSDCIPAVGQGALAIECRKDDEEILQWLAKLNCPKTNRAVQAERAFLNKIGGSCQVPVGGYAVINAEDDVVLNAFVASGNGKTIFKETVVGKDAVAVGEKAGERLMERGAGKLINEILKQLE
ncbi:hydroxymethylbilane synthase [Caldifermentibacillus hisashii]|uniref:Porphobilinogen deaminase n=2 Tax=Bacillaceae TaxID=186817 RepID=A0ABD4A1R2_9BACI|nr:hydroxymethylbilane synthase [Caldibacillus thermoamylovorans]KIO61044.1 Porphobilinogen deaminase [Caldibacillus thermoamylovorans]KIO68887.1 Porphobilinogen deaminase [Caldibacillus thermoamylovorans]KIO70137.1 Porphobilinogen deaminase [Caldibacillus thermoamylovorans]